MRILRFHKLMSVSVFVIMQVCKVKAKMALLFHSDSIGASFFFFFFFFLISITFDSSQCR